MLEVTYYKAEDGKLFEDENECLKYENIQLARSLEGKAEFYGMGKEKIPLDNHRLADDCFYIKILDTPFIKETAKRIHQIFENRECISPFDEYSFDKVTPGLWYWTDENYNDRAWHCWNDEVKKLQDIAYGLV